MVAIRVPGKGESHTFLHNWLTYVYFFTGEFIH